MTEADETIVEQLRESSKGTDEWRVVNKDDNGCCIQFDEWEHAEAMKWWNEHKDKEYYKNYELVKVLAYSQKERLMQEAADMIESLLGQISSQASEKVSGIYKYELSSEQTDANQAMVPPAEATSPMMSATEPDLSTIVNN